MKKILYLSLILILFAACKKDKGPHEDDYNRSLHAWQSYKSSANNSYRYTVYSYDPRGFVAHYYETTITVTNGQVTARVYGDYYLSKDGHQFAAYTEDRTSLGTHQAGAEPITLDQVYTKAKNTWLAADATKNIITFELDANGLMASAGYAPNDCTIECFQGVNIKDIVRL